MPSNVSCVMVDNEFPDSWVEIRNTQDKPYLLSGYRIGEKFDFEKAYKLPDFEIAAGECKLIYCDNKATGLHTDFTLEQGSGKLYLFNGDGGVANALSYSKLPPHNLSCGYDHEHIDMWGYMLTPTPGASNSKVVNIVLPEPVFSKPGCVYINSEVTETVTISIPSGLPDDTKIYYTLDGSAPDINSMSAKELVLLLDTTTVIRAKLLSSEAVSPYTTTNSYIFHPRECSLPIVSINTDDEYLYSSEIGILHGYHSETVKPNYQYDWRRPVNIELFTINSTTAINQLCEVRVQGGGSRIYNQKSLAVYAKKRFGKKSFNYPMWEQKPELKEVKSFLLRNSGNDCARTHLRDAFVQQYYATYVGNLDYQAHEPAICYINGKYKGIYNIRERSNDDYVESNYPDIENFDMIENWNSLKCGDWNRYVNYLKPLISNPKTTYQEISNVIDVDNFLKLFVLEVWCGNTDFPGNNIVMWRPKTANAKWRWIIKDVDFVGLSGKSNPDDNYLDYILRTNDHANDVGGANREQATKLFQFMISKQDFLTDFINHTSVYLGDFLQPALTSEYFLSMCSEIESEYAYHTEAYNYFNQPNNIENHNIDKWYINITKFTDWLKVRNSHVYTYLANYFDLGNPIPVTINVDGYNVSFNGVSLTQPKFDGKYFAGRNIQLNSLDDKENLFWRVCYKYEEQKYDRVNYFEGNELSFMLPENCISVDVALSDTAMSVDSNTNAINVYVDNKMLTIDAFDRKISNIEIVDARGALIKSISTLSVIHYINFDNSGLYIVKIATADGLSVVKKIFIQ